MKRKKRSDYQKKILECLAVILLLGMTTFAASGGIPGTTTTYSTEGSTSAEDATYSTIGGTWVQVDENTWTKDTDSDGEVDVTLVKKGDEWEYLFRTADPDAAYYGWEESVPAGYKVVGKGERKDPAMRAIQKYSHTPNISDDGVNSVPYENNLNLNDVVTIPGATKLHVKLTYGGESANYDWACMWEGKHPEYTAYNDYSKAVSINRIQKFGGGSGTTVECDIVGDSVTFGFRSDGSGNGYGYYAVVTNYAVVTSNVAPDFSITNEEETVTEPEYGSLKLSKVVAGEGADPSQNFLFEINLTSKDATLSEKLKGSITFGDVNFKDGKATVYLKDKDVVELRNIPAGVTWEVKEKATEGYKTEVAVGTDPATETYTSTGEIQKDVTTEVAYTNTKISSTPGGGETPEDPTGSFKVKKVVENGSDTNEFYFSAALTGLKAQKSYIVNITSADASSTRSSSITSNAAGTAYVEFQLKDGETAEFVDLPIGSNYQIKEDANDYTASYEITDEANPENLQAVMSQNGNYESKKELSTQKETLDADEKALIIFTNSKPAPKMDTVDIEVEKSWNDKGNSAKRPSEITVRLYQSTSDKEEGDMIATAKLDESGGWTAIFKDMDKCPVNSTTPYIYTVKEDPVAGYESKVTKDETTHKYTITNTLSTVATGDLRLSKTVDGTGADKEKEFRFELTMKTKDGNALQGSFPLDSGKGKGTKTGTIYFDENGKGTISLKDSESAYITGLPEGTTYNVKETAYVDWTPSLLDGTVWSGTIQKDTTSEIKVKNTYEEKRQLTVKKTVEGSMGSKTKQFQFQLKLTAPEGQVLPTELEYTKGDETKMMQLKNDVYEFTLAHEETIVIKGIPSQSTYTVTEVDGESNGYTVTQTNATGTMKADTTVSFVNTKNGSVPTLADMNTKIPFVLVILAIGGVGFILWKKRKETR